MTIIKSVSEFDNKAWLVTSEKAHRVFKEYDFNEDEVVVDQHPRGNYGIRYRGINGRFLTINKMAKFSDELYAEKGPVTKPVGFKIRWNSELEFKLLQDMLLTIGLQWKSSRVHPIHCPRDTGVILIATTRTKQMTYSTGKPQRHDSPPCDLFINGIADLTIVTLERIKARTVSKAMPTIGGHRMEISKIGDAVFGCTTVTLGQAEEVVRILKEEG